MSPEDTKRLLRDIDAYIEGLFEPSDGVLEAALADSREAGLPDINVSPNQGRLMRLLAETAGAGRILEIGTLGGYSGIHLARALPEDGTLLSLELDEHHADVARKNFERAGLAGIVEVRVGDARDLLNDLVEGGEAPFDLVFIDADKESYPAYLDASLRLVRPGSLILGDNTIRGGDVLEPREEIARGAREFNRKVAENSNLSGIVLPLIRERIDGLTIARVL